MLNRIALGTLLAVISVLVGCGKKDEVAIPASDSTPSSGPPSGLPKVGKISPPIQFPPPPPKPEDATGNPITPLGKAKLPTNSAPESVEGYEVRIGRMSTWGGSENNASVAGPVIYLILAGPGFVEAKGARTIVKVAKEETGIPLKRKFSGFDAKSRDDTDDAPFRPLTRSFGFGSESKAEEYEQQLWYYTPSGGKTIKKLAGHIEVLVPSKDPMSIVTASFAKDAGKPLKNEQLDAAGVEITLRKPSETPSGSATLGEVVTPLYDLSYEIKDPKNQVCLAELFDVEGKKLEVLGTGLTSTGGTSKTANFSIGFKPSTEIAVKFYFATEKATVTIPFEFNDIPLAK